MILISITLPTGGTATYHKVSEIRSVYPFTFAIVDVLSYASQDAFNAGSGHMWAFHETIQGLDVSAGLGAGVEGWLISNAGSPMVGGLIVGDTSETLETAQARRISQLSLDCQSHIYDGFDSDALGAVTHYPADEQDQASLTACVLDSTLPGNDALWTTAFKCIGADGVKEYKLHTMVQIQKVGRDGKNSIMASLLKNEQLAAEVRAATTIEAVAAIVWPA